MSLALYTFDLYGTQTDSFKIVRLVMDEIKERLQTTSQNCFVTYEAWAADKKNTKLREDVQEAVHELRKVASRLEIEVAVSERSEHSHKSMPIPSHRNSQKRPQGNNDGNRGQGEKKSAVKRSLNKRSERPAAKKEG